MSKPCDTALAVLLPTEIAKVVDQWRRLYDPIADAVPAHITVAYPPFMPVNRWSDLAPSIRHTLSAQASFDVCIRSTGVFEAPERVLWLRPEDDGQFAAMHESLAREYAEYVPHSPLAYVPHITLGFFETTQALVSARAVVDGSLTSMTFRAATLSYMEYGEECTWHVVDQIELG
ncbi:MAG TPA: 2'-5' RNA ligase family protein [Anaerolineae bacterium]|jgi:2'-5' RNA ligase